MSHFSRRQFLTTAGTGFGMLALVDLMARAGASTADPLAPKQPHHPARAKRCIFLYMPGGPSQIDTFDPKPRVVAEHGKPLPFAKPRLERTRTGNLFGSPWKFDRHGACGTEVSELFPNIARKVDDLCVIRSMVADNINHTGAALQMMTGEQAFSRPSLGSWLLYGLGSENEDLPGYVVVSPTSVFQGAPLYMRQLSAVGLPGYVRARSGQSDRRPSPRRFGRHAAGQAEPDARARRTPYARPPE